MSKVVRKVAVVHGQVQGVFFRDSCRREAESLDVTGSATNLENGTVEVILEGSPEDVGKMIDWCRVGPPHARVTNVEIEEETPRGLTDFVTR